MYRIDVIRMVSQASDEPLNLPYTSNLTVGLTNPPFEPALALPLATMAE